MTNMLSGPVLELKLNGQKLSNELMNSIEETILEEELNTPSMLTLKFNSVKFLTGAWQGVNLDLFQIGDELRVSMGLDKEVLTMTGEIVGLEATFGDEASFVEIRAYDRLHRLRFGRQSRSFRDMKDSDIAAIIAREVKLSYQTDDSQTVHPYLFQNNQSNFHFLLGRARENGFEIAVEDRTLFFCHSREKENPKLTLEYKKNLDSFAVQLHTLTSGSIVEVTGWDVNRKKVISTKVKTSQTNKMAGKVTGFEMAEKVFGASKIKLWDEGVKDALEAEQIGQAKYNALLLEFLTGQGKCRGNPRIRVGKTVNINLSKTDQLRFSGIYYVVSTTHSINQQGYTTTFNVKRNGV